MIRKLSLAIGFAAILGGSIAPRLAVAEGIAIAEVKHDGDVDFEREVLPILRRKCLACHNATTAESDLVLETPQTILKGGVEGPAIVPGKGLESLLLKLAAQTTEPTMPPQGNDVGARPLTPEELGLIKLWIDQGGKGEVLGAAAPIVWQPLPPGVNPVYAVAVSETGEFAAAGRANQVFLYHLPSRRELGRLTDPALLQSGVYKNPGVADLDLIQSMAFNPAGDLLATGGYRTLKLWRRPQNVRQFDLAALASPAKSSAASSDGKWIALGDEGGVIYLYDNATGQLTGKLEGHQGAVNGLAFTADSSRLLSGSADKSVRIWNVADGQVIARVDTPVEVNALALYAQDNLFATGGPDNLVRLWKMPVAAADPLAKLAVKSNVLSVSGDRKYLAYALDDGKIGLIDLTTGGAAGELPGHPGGTSYLAFNAANNRLVSIGADKKVSVWSFTEGKQVFTTGLEAGTPTAASVNAAGNQLAVGADDGAIRTWKLDAPEPQTVEKTVGDHKQPITQLIYVADGSAFVTSCADGTVRRFSAAGDQQFSANHGARIQALTISPDQQWLASGGDDKQIKIWNAGSGAPGAKPQLGGFTGAVVAVAFAPDGKQVLASDADAKQVLAFSLELGTLQESHPQAQAATSITVLPQGDKDLFVLTGAADKTVSLWPLTFGRQLAGHGQPVVALAVVSESQIASASADGAIKVWDVNNGNSVRDLNHGGPITGLVVRADGQRLISAGANNVAKIFNLQNNQVVAEVRGDFNTKYGLEARQRELALAKKHIELAKKDLEEATKRKQSEEENAKKADEALKKADEEAKAKTEAAKKPTEDKEAADKALAEATTAKTTAEENQKKAAEEQTKNNEAFTKATQVRDEANKAATETANAAKQAADKLTQAKEAAAKEPDNAGLAEAVKTAEKEAADTDAKAKAAAQAKDAADKAFATAEAAKKSADEAKQKADQELNTANNTFNQADQKVKQVTPPYQKAVDEMTAAVRNLEASQRSVERSKVAVKTATEAIPGYDAAVKTAEANSMAAEKVVADATKSVQDSEKPYRSIALSPDGLTVAIGGENNTVYTFDTETGAAVNSYRGHAAPIVALAYTAGGNLVSAAADKSAIVWNTSPIWTLERTIGSPDGASPIEDRVTAIGFSPDGSLVATGSGEPSRSGELKIWKVADGALAQEIKEPHSDTIYDVEFSPDGKYIATCGADRFMKVFNLGSGQLHRSYEGHTHHVLGVAWRADGRMLASSGADNVIKVWDFITGDQVRTIQGFGKEVTSITFAGLDSSVLASSGDRSVQMKNAENGGNVRNYGGAQDFVYSVDVSADAKTVVAGTADGIVLVWNDQGQNIATFAPPKPAPADATASK